MSFKELMADVQDRLRVMFLPDKKDVSSDYWEFLKWRLSQVGETTNVVISSSMINYHMNE